ncbi:MAG: MOSC domain-containing protein [Colwellia sp.]
MKKNNRCQGVYCGKVAQNYGIETAIDKLLVTGPVFLSETGLAGDECADKHHHGGTERALHQYPAEHYDYWREKYGHDINWQAPGMGENLSSTGMSEDNVCIGDKYQWGEAIIEVSQPRSPCFKLNNRWGLKNFATNMQDISRCGWLYRVIKPGIVSINEPLLLIHQECNAMTIAEVCQAFFIEPLNKTGLLKLQQQKKLSQNWLSRVELRLESNQVENWNFRLIGKR